MTGGLSFIIIGERGVTFLRMELMFGSDPKERNLEDRYYEQAAACARERNCMNEVNKTLYIPLYGKSKVSRQGIILNDPSAEEIWKEEAFPIHGKSKSKWLAYNMAMRARVFDDWTVSCRKTKMHWYFISDAGWTAAAGGYKTLARNG